jgi:intracellular sulfur oxidation DsrE/DsrF family protein
MIVNHSSRLVLICAAVALAGGCALTAGAEAQTPAEPKAGKSEVGATHKVAIQVSDNDKNLMNRALNNTKNLVDFYQARGETVVVEIVTFHDGLHMLRSESPVKDRIAVMSLENPNIKFIACANTQANQSKAEGKPVTLLSEATIMPSGIVRLIELQKQGYAYIRP